MSDSKVGPLSDDGELSNSFFCVYCGELNPMGTAICKSCGRYIGDQGPDLSARLHRIKRYASPVHAGVKATQPDDASPAGYDPNMLVINERSDADITWHLVDVGATLERIKERANFLDTSPGEPPYPLGAMGTVAWVGFFAIMLGIVVIILFDKLHLLPFWP
jgi:hypothetical protein